MLGTSVNELPIIHESLPVFSSGNRKSSRGAAIKISLKKQTTNSYKRSSLVPYFYDTGMTWQHITVEWMQSC